jgi:hypothetical protein
VVISNLASKVKMLSLVANRMLVEVIHTLGIKVKVAYIIAEDIDLRITTK